MDVGDLEAKVDKAYITGLRREPRTLRWADVLEQRDVQSRRMHECYPRFRFRHTTNIREQSAAEHLCRLRWKPKNADPKGQSVLQAGNVEPYVIGTFDPQC